MSQFAKKLAGMKGKWAKAKELAPDLGFAVVPDGTYKMALVGAELGESKNGRFQITFDWQIMGGEHDGVHAKEFLGLETEENLAWVCRRVDEFGYESANLDIADLESFCEQAVADQIVARIKLHTKGEYQNHRFQERLEGEEFPEITDGKSGAAAAEPEAAPEPAPKKGPAKKPTATPVTAPAPAKGGKGKNKPEPEPEAGAEAEGEATIEAGSRVKFTRQGTEVEGEVVEVLDGGLTRVRADDDSKVYRVKTDALEAE